MVQTTLDGIKTYKDVTLGIVGSRTCTDVTRMFQETEKLIRLLYRTRAWIVVRGVSGGAVGADTLAREFFHTNEITFTEFLPRSKVPARKDFHARNQEIVDLADVLFCFWDGLSRGTLDTIRRAERKNIPIYIIRINEDWCIDESRDEEDSL